MDKQIQEMQEELRRKEQRVRDLEAKLSATDYQVIKCYESELMKEAAPYDAKAVIEGRQKIRDEINALQAEIAKLSA